MTTYSFVVIRASANFRNEKGEWILAGQKTVVTPEFLEIQQAMLDSYDAPRHVELGNANGDEIAEFLKDNDNFGFRPPPPPDRPPEHEEEPESLM